MAEHRTAFLRQARHVQAGCGVAIDMRAHGEDCRDRGRVNLRPRLILGGKLAIRDGDKAWTEAIDAGQIGIASRLIDPPLAPELGLDRLDRQAVGLQ